MITRYSRPEMVSLWSMENFFRLCFEIEAHTCDALAERGVIPKAAAKEIWEKGKFSLERIEEIENQTRHQFIAFLSNVSENIGDASRYLHQGMTSTDVLDTALCAQLKAAGDILTADILKVMETLRHKAIEYKDVLCMGRTHGMHAEPTTFGFKLLGYYTEFARNFERMRKAQEEVSVCAISGAVGNFANLEPFIEQYVADKMGLLPEPVSTQVIPRDRHAMFFATLGVIASSIERLATEIRHLQRTEVGEASEFFHVGQKGSSAMPHKSNPVLCENLTGLARLVRSAVTPALEDVVLWHERDISHSSVERVIAPDATITLDFALNRLAEVLNGMQVNKERMLANINLQKGLVYSQRVLLALVDKGMLRDNAYKLVQGAAMKVWHGEGNFQDILLQDTQVTDILSPDEIAELFNPAYYIRNIDAVFKRVLGV
ncbi:MAG: adenylosuccinate lyase [Alphaproteobacteria bacterium]|nr:adenylosuccinate lyase [Alphaproteobacteria bacterium]